MFLILADTAANGGFDWSTIAPAVSAIGSTGLAVWLCIYTQTTTLPNQQKEHREQIKEINDTNARMIERIVGEMKDQRDLHESALKDLREAFERWRMTLSGQK